MEFERTDDAEVRGALATVEEIGQIWGALLWSLNVWSLFKVKLGAHAWREGGSWPSLSTVWILWAEIKLTEHVCLNVFRIINRVPRSHLTIIELLNKAWEANLVADTRLQALELRQVILDIDKVCQNGRNLQHLGLAVALLGSFLRLSTSSCSRCHVSAVLRPLVTVRLALIDFELLAAFSVLSNSLIGWEWKFNTSSSAHDFRFWTDRLQVAEIWFVCLQMKTQKAFHQEVGNVLLEIHCARLGHVFHLRAAEKLELPAWLSKNFNNLLQIGFRDVFAVGYYKIQLPFSEIYFLFSLGIIGIFSPGICINIGLGIRAMISQLDFVILLRILQDSIFTHCWSLLWKPSGPQFVVLLILDEGFSCWSCASVVLHQFALGLGLNDNFTQLSIKVYFINKNAQSLGGAELGKQFNQIQGRKSHGIAGLFLAEQCQILHSEPFLVFDPLDQ